MSCNSMFGCCLKKKKKRPYVAVADEWIQNNWTLKLEQMFSVVSS
jgi:hypothetical protein